MTVQGYITIHDHGFLGHWFGFYTKVTPNSIFKVSLRLMSTLSMKNHVLKWCLITLLLQKTMNSLESK